MKAKKRQPDRRQERIRLRRPISAALILKFSRTSEPPGRKGGVKVKDVTELVSKLKNEAGVL